MSKNDLQQYQVFSEHVLDGLKCNIFNYLFQNKISLEKTHALIPFIKGKSLLNARFVMQGLHKIPT